MIIESYDPAKHTESLRAWLKARSLEDYVLSDLPQVGYVVSNMGELTAAGFLRICEGATGLIDSVITNPSASGNNRHKAMDLLTITLLERAAGMHLKRVIAFSTDQNTLIRGQRLGFSLLPHQVIAINLQEKV